MQQKSVSQATRNGERKAPQGCQDFFTNSEEQSKSIDEAGESSSARYPMRRAVTVEGDRAVFLRIGRS